MQISNFPVLFRFRLFPVCSPCSPHLFLLMRMQEVKYELVSGIHCFITIYFFISTVAVISSSIIQPANYVTLHGKLRINNLGNAKIVPTRIKSISLILEMSVNKGWFRYFYLVGVIVTVCCIYSSHKNYRILFFLVHIIRRLFEEVFISRHETKYSRMNIFVFLFGISYYIIMPITIMITEDIRKSCLTLQFVLFGIFSLIQYKTHVILSNIKDKNHEKYGIPYGGIFKFISCPHYFSEIGIYLSLFFDTIFDSRLLHIKSVLLYIVVCMYVNAIRTHKWYINYYKESYICLNRKAIFPFII